MNTNPTTIGQYLIERLLAHGVKHVFGVPGDYVLGFFQEMAQSELHLVNTCDEQGAGFAADAYARLNGLGVVCVTYCVGGLKIANTTAQAFAEKSPVIVISGAPGTDERIHDPLLHHKVRSFDTQLKVFEQLTVATAVLDNPLTACSEINRVLEAALHHCRPVYIELPRNMVHAPVFPMPVAIPVAETSDPNALAEALREATAMIAQAKRPVILAGEELHRFGLQSLLNDLVEETDIPVAATILGKSVFPESHRRYLGIYEGALSHPEICDYVESSDCLICLGSILTEIDLGIYTAHLNQDHCIYVSNERLAIRFHRYDHVQLRDFLEGLVNAHLSVCNTDTITQIKTPEFQIDYNQRITLGRLFGRLDTFIDQNTIVIAEPGDALFSGADLHIQQRNRFLSPAHYTSLGFAVPAALGAQLADPTLRPLVLVGDGAFQMTGMELSTIVRFGLNPIVVVLNNQGYATERPMEDGRFNDVLNWHYSRLSEVFGAGQGFTIRTEGQLETALYFASQHTGSFCILDVQLEPNDTSLSLKRLTQVLAERVHSTASM
jgi:TPP-dependent 2-oxoacid decarboxylase